MQLGEALADQSHGAWEQGSPGKAQIPQLGLQQTSPALQVLIPQGTLCGCSIGLLHGRRSQVCPGCTQVPQLALQQIWPTLQVFGPQATLLGTTGMPQAS